MRNVSRQPDISHSEWTDNLLSLIEHRMFELLAQKILFHVSLTLTIFIPTLFKLLFIIFKQVANECV